MEALLGHRGDLQIVHTYFSPSAEDFPAAIPAGFSGYLPWDTRSDLLPVLAALSPDLLVFTKTEVWPVLSREAGARGIPMALVAAALPEGAGRLRWPGRALLRPAFSRLGVVTAIAEPDARRFPRLGVPPGRIEITGDPGIDSALGRLRMTDSEADFLQPLREDPRPTLVAGSTWTPDEEILIPACTRIREGGGDLRMIIAPHETTPSHVRALEANLRGRGWVVRTLTEVVEKGGGGAVDAIVVDRVGVLAHLYTVGAMAYVGGGFHRGGLHSVLEPAAADLPVAFGPRHENARAAFELLERGGAEEVRSANELTRVLQGWLRDEGSRRIAAAAAFGYLEEHRGASERTAALLLDRFDGSLSTRRENLRMTTSEGPRRASPGALDMTPAELKQRLDHGHPLVLVDVRDPGEREIADLPDYGQRRIPLHEFHLRIGELDRDDNIVLYCRTGVRSGFAAHHLRRMGFEKVWNLADGVMGWREEIDPSLRAY